MTEFTIELPNQCGIGEIVITRTPEGHARLDFIDPVAAAKRWETENAAALDAMAKRIAECIDNDTLVEIARERQK